MRLRRQLILAFVLGTLLSGRSVPALRGDDPLLAHSQRVALRGIASDLSRLGLRTAVERMLAVLEAAGDPPQTLAKLQKTRERNLARERHGRNQRSLLARLGKQTALIAAQLEEAHGRRAELIELLLALDSQEPRANQALGRVLHAGLWDTREASARETGRQRVAGLVQAARRFEVDLETGTSDSQVFATLAGEQANFARAHGIAIHARLGVEKLERILRQALRASALSSALLTDVLAIPAAQDPSTVLFMDSVGAYEQALQEARDHGGLSQADYDLNLEQKMRSFSDLRGWRTSRWRTEVDYQALILWVLIERTLGPAAQPCLEAGHLNWLALELLGTSMPIVAWQESSGTAGGGARTRVTREAPFRVETLWRSARRTLFGCRSWMIQRAREGRDPPWARSLVDHVGKVSDENLLKSTLVAAFLHETGAFAGVLESTRGSEDRVAAFETALASTLPAFEERWRRWLLRTPATPPGVVQLVTQSGEPPAAPDDPRRAALLGGLNAIRRAAFAGQWPEFEAAAIDDELSAGALAHARYLGLNEEQQRVWPDVHEEYADRPGFTPAGSRAGLRSVVAFTDDPAEALEQWMGTFYHRLPLLDPGMFGVGFAAAGGVAVFDVTSLVLQPWRDHRVLWPHDGMTAVPTAFVSELPNPVPGEDQRQWGYPITLQLFLLEQQRAPDITLQLFEGAAEGPEVDCWFLSPDQPRFPELAPENTWCLIPKLELKRGTTYTVVARSAAESESRTWSFETE